MTAYYNEFDPFAAAWLRNLISNGLIADGFVDERSILEVEPADLAGFTQCHFFAGIGGWSLALALAGWPDDKPVWTGSPPCQPYSVAGKGKAQADERHLWPELFRLIAECRPPVVFGEQVANAIGKGWLDGVFSDLEGEDYACGALVLPACSVDAPHKRDRVWFVADSMRAGRPERRPIAGARSSTGDGGALSVADADYAEWRAEESGRNLCYGQASGRLEGDGDVAERGDEHVGYSDDEHKRSTERHETRAADVAWPSEGFWSDHEWIIGTDGKARRVKPGIQLLVNGFPNRVGLLRGFGNAIVPPLAAEFIKAFIGEAA